MQLKIKTRCVKVCIGVATKPLLGDLLNFRFTLEHDAGLSVPQRLVLRRCVMNDTLRDCPG